MIRLHPLSALLGAAAVGLCLLTMSQMRVAAAVIGVEYLPHPRDMVQISEGTPYTVPAGKILVVTGLGGDGRSFISYQPALLRANGLPVVTTGILFQSGAPTSSSVVTLPECLTLPAGATVDVTGAGMASDDARAWGYLAAQ